MRPWPRYRYFEDRSLVFNNKTDGNLFLVVYSAMCNRVIIRSRKEAMRFFKGWYRGGVSRDEGMN